MATKVIEPKLEEGQEIVEFKKRGFDLNKFERVSLSGKFVFTPVKDTTEALERIGNDTEKFLDLINSAMKRNEIQEKKTALIDKEKNPDIVSSAKAIMQFAAGFYAIPPYNKITDKKERKKAVFAFIRGNESLMAALKVIAAATPDVDDDDDESDESEA